MDFVDKMTVKNATVTPFWIQAGLPKGWRGSETFWGSLVVVLEITVLFIKS